MEQDQPVALRWLEKVARAGSWLGGIALLSAALIIGVDLLLRKIVGVSLGAADEIAGYVLAIVSAWAFPVALLKRSHIRVDVLYARLSLKARVGLDIFALTCMGVFVGVLVFHAWNVLYDSILFGAVSNSPLQVSLWIPQSLWFMGYVFFAISVLVLMFCTLRQIFRGRWRAANGLVGINSVEEDIKEETHPELHPGGPASASSSATGVR